MSVEAASVAPGRSWLRGGADVLGLGAAGFGAALAAALLVAFAVWELALGRLAVARLPGDPQAALDDARVAVNHILCTAYLAAAFVHALRAGERTLDRLRRQLAPDAAPIRFLETRDRGLLAMAGLAGAAASLTVGGIATGDVSFDPRSWSAEVAWHRVLGITMGVLSLRLGALLVLQSLRLSRLAAQVRELDLLELSPLAPFGQQGLVNALLILGFAAVYSLFLVDLRYLGIGLVVLAFTASVATLGLLAPLAGARRRVREAKHAELAWCRARLREARRLLEEGIGVPDPGTPPLSAEPPLRRRMRRAHLDELVAWEERVEAVREWPLDPAVLRRFALYLLIPLVSWSGAALVERWIDAVLE